MQTDIAISQNICSRWLECFETHTTIYLHAMKGYGKTTQSKEFAGRYFDRYRMFDAAHADFLQEIENWLINCANTTQKKLIIIDNIEQITDEKAKKQLSELLSLQVWAEHNIKIILLGTEPLPKYLLSLKLSENLVVEDKKALQMGHREIISLIKSNTAFAQIQDSDIKKYANICLEFSDGYPVAVVFFLQRLSDDVYDTQSAISLATNDLQGYFELMMQDESISLRELLLRLCVFDTFTMQMAKAVIADISKEDITRLMTCGYLETIPPHAMRFEPNFYRYLQGEMLKTDLFDPKNLLEIAGDIYETKRDMKSALHCYNLAENYDKIQEIVIYLSENADGCEFAEICDEYMDKLSANREEGNPRLLGAKAMIEAYSLRKHGYDSYMERLKKLAEDKKDNTTLAVYMRTLIACPISNSDNLKESLILFAEYVIKNGVKLEFITPTGNMPSLLNGGLDLLPWIHSNKMFQTMMKTVAETVIGFEAVGVFDTIMGEVYYERNQKSAAIESLAKGLDEANREGSIRMQYVATAVMIRLYCAENNIEKAWEVAERFYEKAKKENFFELLPNISASEVQLALLKNDTAFCKSWLGKSAPDEHKKFYLTQRHLLFTKAKVYVALGRDLDALHIITVLERYSKVAQRRYFAAQLALLKAIILHSRQEPWQEHLLQAVKIAQEYGLVRLLADEGGAVLPIFREINWENTKFSREYIGTVEKEMAKMARIYPNYLKPTKTFIALTKKETEVLHLLAQGHKNEQMAKELSVSVATVKFHVSNIMNKFEVKNRASIITAAYEQGIL